MFSMFCRYLCEAYSGVLLLALFNTAVGGEGGERSRTPTFSMFCRYLCEAYSGVLLLALFSTAVGEGGRRKESDSNVADTVVPEVLLLESSSNSGGPVARRKKTNFEDDIGEFGVQLLPPTATWKSLR